MPVGSWPMIEARLTMAAGAAVERLGTMPVAVRSSAIAEDLPGASFAGQYETVIGARGVGQVSAAIERCLDSGRSQRVDTYALREAGLWSNDGGADPATHPR